jgi:hypothetical protein
VLELFHRLPEPASAAARREVTTLGLKDRVDFRNVDYYSHARVLVEHGGAVTPALWDGAALHVGLDDVLAALRAEAAR